MSTINFDGVVAKFDPIRLDQMDSVQLMNRVDTKFAFSESTLLELLPQLSENYFVLDINGVRISSYESVYYDDKLFGFYNDHHRQLSNRYKIRKRKYVESDISFLEIKHKVNGRTKKSRIPVKDIDMKLESEQIQFIKDNGIDLDLQSSIINNFNRITLVNKNMEERLTLDLNLMFKWDNEDFPIRNTVIAELKQGKQDRHSAFYKMMKVSQIRPLKISKYCVGIISVYGKKRIKYNRFKKKLLL